MTTLQAWTLGEERKAPDITVGRYRKWEREQVGSMKAATGDDSFQIAKLINEGKAEIPMFLVNEKVRINKTSDRAGGIGMVVAVKISEEKDENGYIIPSDSYQYHVRDESGRILAVKSENMERLWSLHWKHSAVCNSANFLCQDLMPV